MPERPPPGYNRQDRPLPHEFFYRIALSSAGETLNSTILSFLTGGTGSADPDTIEVNPDNGTFAVDAGSAVCFDSIVQKINIQIHMSLTNLATQTDQVNALSIATMPIMGAFEDSWTAVDSDSGLTPQTILELNSDNTVQDVHPLWSTVNLPGQTGNHPLSTITDAESATTDIGLTTNAIIESVAFSQDTLWDMMQFSNIGKKLSTVMGTYRNYVLTRNRPHTQIFINKFTPRHVRFAHENLFFGMLFHTEVDGEQLHPAAELTTDAAHFNITAKVRFNEWNPDFDQRRS